MGRHLDLDGSDFARVRAPFDRRRPSPGRPSTAATRRDRAPRRPPRARPGAPRTQRPAARRPGVRRRRLRSTVGDGARHRGERVPHLAAGDPERRAVQGPHRCVPRRGRTAPRQSGGRHVPPVRLHLRLVAGGDHADALRPGAQLPVAGARVEDGVVRPAQGRGHRAARARPLLRRLAVRVRLPATGGVAARTGTRSRCVLPLVRAALGRDAHGGVGVVLDPLLHAFQRAGRVREPRQRAAAEAAAGDIVKATMLRSWNRVRDARRTAART